MASRLICEAQCVAIGLVACISEAATREQQHGVKTVPEGGHCLNRVKTVPEGGQCLNLRQYQKVGRV